jgi:hypothetical protein
VLVALVASGCAGDAGTKAVPSASAPTDPTMGSIQGSVVNEEVQPVEGAAVGLSDDRTINTKTDSLGRFTLVGVAPGSHRILVQMDGYKTTTLDVTVAGAEAANAKIILKAVPHLVPRQASYVFNGYLGMDLGIPSGNQYGQGPAGATKRSVYYAVEPPDLISAFAGVKWAGNVPVTSDRMFFVIFLALDKAKDCDDAARDYCVPMAAAEGKSPLVNGSSDYQDHIRDRSGLRLNVRFKMRPCTTSDVGPGWADPSKCPNPMDLVKFTVDQKVDAYTTLFYGQAAPAGFKPFPP